MKKLIAGLCIGAMCLTTVFAAACDTDGDKKPEKLKDGISLTIEEEKTETVDLSQYISIPEGTDYEYSVISSAKTVATVSLSENIATISAVSVGQATITASAGEVSVGFAVTVKAAPVAVDKTALKAEIDKEITEQGEYTKDSFDAYTAKLQAAKTVYAKTDVAQSEVDTACNELKAAQTALLKRKPVEKNGANKTLSVLGGNAKEITLSDYIDENGLNGVEYEVTCDSQKITVGDIEEGKVTLTAQTVEEDEEVTVTVKATKNGETEVVLNLVVLSELRPVLKSASISKDVDVYTLTDKTLSLNLAENIADDHELTLAYAAVSAAQGVSVTVTEGVAECVLNGSYATPAEVEITVTVSYGEQKSVEYTYTLNVCDTGIYRVQNGGFLDGLDGWTLSDATNPIGEISELGTFWENLPVFNDGKYFRGESKEGNTGTLASSEFVVGGINKITFMFGAGNNCYLTLEKPDGTVLAVWRNVKFHDLGGGWSADEIGKTQFALNLVTYVADLSAWEGQTVKLVINDEATGGIGFVTFDELVTYYVSEEALPAGAIAAVNELADKTALQEKVTQAKAITQGDYTAESFAALTEKITAAEALLANKGATAQKLAQAVDDIETAKTALTLRVPEERTGVQKTLSVKSGNTLTVDPEQFVDIKALSSITYELTAPSENLSINGLVLTAGTVAEDTDESVSLIVKYKGETVLTVALTVKITSGDKPVVNNPSVTESIDVYSLTNKSKYKLDFTQNIGNPSNLTLVYTVKIGESTEPLTLDAQNCYEYNLDGQYSDTATDVIFNVEVGSTANAHKVSYVYTLKIKDSTAYRIVNGGFDNDLDGWTSTGTSGGISTAETFWGENPMHNKGKYFASDDAGKGTLTSSLFTVGGTGKISFMLGCGKNKELCTLSIVSESGTTLATYNNYKFNDIGSWDVNEIGKTQFGLNLVMYVADLSAFKGQRVKIVLTDDQEGDCGFLNLDEVVTYYETEEDMEQDLATKIGDRQYYEAKYEV